MSTKQLSKKMQFKKNNGQDKIDLLTSVVSRESSDSEDLEVRSRAVIFLRLFDNRKLLSHSLSEKHCILCYNTSLGFPNF